MSDENDGHEETEKVDLQEVREVLVEALSKPVPELAPAPVGAVVTLAQGKDGLMAQVDESMTDMLHTRIVERAGEPTVSDIIMMFADEAMRQTDDEVTRRLRYYKQIQSLVNDNARFIAAITLLAERLGVEIEIDGKRHVVSMTNIPGLYNNITFSHIIAHATTRVSRLLASVENDGLRIRDLEKDNTQLDADKKRIVDGIQQKIAIAVTPIRDDLDKTKERNTELIAELQKRVDPRKRQIVLAMRDDKGKALMVCLRGETEEDEVPALTGDFTEAHTFETEEDAHNFRARLIRAVRDKQIRFHRGLNSARALSIAHVEVCFDD